MDSSRVLMSRQGPLNMEVGNYSESQLRICVVSVHVDYVIPRRCLRHDENFRSKSEIQVLARNALIASSKISRRLNSKPFGGNRHTFMPVHNRDHSGVTAVRRSLSQRRSRPIQTPFPGSGRFGALPREAGRGAGNGRVGRHFKNRFL